MLGVPESQGPSGVTMLTNLFTKGGGRQGGASEGVFELGARVKVLEGMDKQAVVPFMAETEGSKFPYEVVFRCVPQGCVARLGVIQGL